MSLIARSKLARCVAAHIVRYGTQPTVPEGCTTESYHRALLRLEKAGVLQRWDWIVDGLCFRPRSPTASCLWLAGPRWEEFRDEARALGLVPHRAAEKQGGQ